MEVQHEEHKFVFEYDAEIATKLRQKISRVKVRWLESAHLFSSIQVGLPIDCGKLPFHTGPSSALSDLEGSQRQS